MMPRIKNKGKQEIVCVYVPLKFKLDDFMELFLIMITYILDYLKNLIGKNYIIKY